MTNINSRLKEHDPKVIREARKMILEMELDESFTRTLPAHQHKALSALIDFMDDVADYMADNLGMKDVLLTEDDLEEVEK